MFLETFLKSFFTVLSAVIGAGVIFFIKLDHKKLCSLISLSAGALLSAAVFTLIPESASNLPLYELLLGIFSGYALFWIISKYFSHVCPACSASHFDEKTTHKFSEIVLTLLTALSIHSFLDGVAISSGIENHRQLESVFIAILAHKFPEGLALAALMISTGYSNTKIITYVILVELVTMVGAFSGYYLFSSSVSPVLLSIVMSHIAGGFIFLSVHAVLGEMLKNHKNLVIFSFLSGGMIIFFIHLIFS